MEVIDLEGCDICGADHNTVLCPELGLDQTQVEFSQLSTRARLTLPPFVQVVDNGSGLVGVVAKDAIKRKTQLGPYEAKRTTHIFDDFGFFTVKLISKDGSTVCLDTTDENECNWLCLVRAAVASSTQNCMAYQLGADIFYNTTRDIMAGEELQVWYAPNFARKLGKPTEPDGETRVLLGHRIEPLATDLVLETSAAPSEGVSDQEDGGDTVTQMQESAELTRGEIRKAIYCPRCGNTFKTQSEMVHHLREHVIDTVYKDTPHGRRKPGRPRKHPLKLVDKQEQKESTDKSDKSQLADHEHEEENGISDESDDYEDYDEERESKRLKVKDRDEDFTCTKDIQTSGQRVQPSRRRKGRHSKYAQDFVVAKLGRKVKQEPGSENSKGFRGGGAATGDNGESKDCGNSVGEGFKNKKSGILLKRGRGRPRKVAQKLKDETKFDKTTNMADTLGPEQIQAAVKALEKEDIDEMGDMENANIEEVDTLPGAIEVDRQLPDVDCENNNADNKDNGAGTDIMHENNNTAEKSETTPDANLPEKENIDFKDAIHNINMVAQETCDDENQRECKVEDNEYCSDDSNKDSKNEGDLGNVDETVDHDDGSNDMNKDLDKESDNDGEDEMADNGLEVSEKSTLLKLIEESGEKIYNCVLCEEKFSQEVEAIAHFMGHKNGWRTCKICQKHFDTDTELEKHRSECDQKQGFSCDICQQAFKSAHYLYRHMIMHTDFFNCVKCKKTFSRKDSLQKHVLKCCPYLAESYKIYSCEVCNRVFSTPTGKAKHLKKCTSMKCEACKKVFSSEELYKIHDCKGIETDENMTGKFSCGKCSRSFQSMYYLKQHILLHEKHHVCENCGKNLMTKEDLEGHQPLCATLEAIRSVGWGTCDKCNKVFNNQKYFRDHYMSHTHPYACNKCGKRFIKVGTLSSHCCASSQSFECPFCNKTFKNQAGLERHDIERGCMRYECSACGQQFRMKKDANLHNCESATEETPATIVYLTDMKEVCAVCGKSFSTRSNLNKHMILHGDKNLKCPHCPKHFHLEVYLREHITCVHYNVYKYQCTGCGKMLKSKTALMSHTKLFHTDNVETYDCETCGKKFKQKGNLRTHMYSHSTERNFKCDLCARSFKYPDQLSKHRMEHNSGKKLSCDQCDKQFCRGYELRRHQQVYHSGNIYVCGVCSARCGHRHTLIRHYKRKHVEEYPLVLQEGYVDSLLKNSSEFVTMPPMKNTGEFLPTIPPMVRLGEKAEYVLLVPKNDKAESSSQTQESIEEDASKSTPETAAEALQSLALGNITPKQLEILKDKELFIKGDGSIDNSSFNLIEDSDTMITKMDSLTPGIISEQESVSENATTDSSVALQPASNAIQLIQNTDGSVNYSNIQGMTQSIEGLEGMEGQIVILQIVDPDLQDPASGEIVQAEKIQQAQTQEVQAIIDQGALVQSGENEEQKVSDLPVTSMELNTQSTSLQGVENLSNENVFSTVKLVSSKEASDLKEISDSEVITGADVDAIGRPESGNIDTPDANVDDKEKSPLIIVSETVDVNTVKNEPQSPVMVIGSKPLSIDLEQGLQNLSTLETGTDDMVLGSAGGDGQQVIEIGMVSDVQPVAMEMVVEKSMEGLAEDELDIVMENV